MEGYKDKHDRRLWRSPWRPAADQVGKEVSVIVSVKDAAGQERLHTFTVAVRDGK